MALLKIPMLIFGLATAAAWCFGYFKTKHAPTLPETWWGPGNEESASTTIRPFAISMSRDTIDDLKHRLSNTKFGAQPLKGSAWTYGMSSNSLRQVAAYWLNDYNFTEREALLNRYPQFLTNIQGLDIHFLDVAPKSATGKRVLPLLLQHGWPGSVVEFYKIIPLLTTPRMEHDFVFRVIVPSLPGFGFSDAAVIPGCGPAQIAVILKNLMRRIGFEQFYTQGGDWGAIVTSDMAAMFPQHVLGIHLNMCGVNTVKTNLKTIFYSFVPSFLLPEDFAPMYPLLDHWTFLLRESGYFHIQATKPDTVGAALSDSPAGLAAYILEKFSIATNDTYRFFDDGGLLEKFTMDELLDNLMMYWLPNKISSAVRIYAEAFTAKYQTIGLGWAPIEVPSACAQFPNEIAYQPASLLQDRYKNLVRVTRMSRGGHFAAMEEPKLLADDIWASVAEMEHLRLQPAKVE